MLRTSAPGVSLANVCLASNSRFSGNTFTALGSAALRSPTSFQPFSPPAFNWSAMPLVSLARKGAMSTTSRPGSHVSTSPIHKVEPANASLAAACSAGPAPVARKRVFSSSKATFFPRRRITSICAGPGCARSRPIGAEPSPVRSAVV